jgi:hypothetical protein
MDKFQKSVQRLQNLHCRKWNAATLERKLVKAARGVLCKICRKEGQADPLAEEWMENEYVRNNLLDQTQSLEPPFVAVFPEARSASTQMEQPSPGLSNEEEALKMEDGRGRAIPGAIIDETKVEGIAATRRSDQENARAMGSPEKTRTLEGGVRLLAFSRFRSLFSL